MVLFCISFILPFVPGSAARKPRASSLSVRPTGGLARTRGSAGAKRTQPSGQVRDPQKNPATNHRTSVRAIQIKSMTMITSAGYLYRKQPAIMARPTQRPVFVLTGGSTFSFSCLQLPFILCDCLLAPGFALGGFLCLKIISLEPLFRGLIPYDLRYGRTEFLEACQ
jgi:hypothetical protein